MLPDRFSRIVDRIYAAADGSEPWTTPLGDLRALFGARMTSVLEHRHGTAPDVVRDALGLDPALRVSYERYYWARNVYMQWGRHLIVPGRVAPHEVYCSDRDIMRSEYYQDFQRHLGLLRVIVAALKSSSGSTVLVTVNRGPHDPPFSSHDSRVLAMLLPHFQRAVSIQERLQAAVPAVPVASAPVAVAPAAVARWRLTPAEAAVAERLAAGQSVSDICAALGIRVTTARTHLRHLLQKTGTRRQAELVARLLHPDDNCRGWTP